MIDIQEDKSSIESWQIEAAKLAQQGKLEQTKAIEDKILHYSKVPWDIIDKDKYKSLYNSVINNSKYSKKDAIRLLNYALIYDNHIVIKELQQQNIKAAHNLKKANEIMVNEYFYDYVCRNHKVMLEKIKRYGINFRNQFNMTPIMCAAYVLNDGHINELKNNGANLELVDNRHRNALMIALSCALRDTQQMIKFNNIFNKVCPPAIYIQIDSKLIKIEPHKGEFFLLILIMTLIVAFDTDKDVSFNCDAILSNLNVISDEIVPDFRKKRNYVNSLLARNEVNSNYSNNRQLFMRIKIGQYILNPELKFKIANEWVKLK